MARMEAEATSGYMSVLSSYAELEEPQPSNGPALGRLDSFCMSLIATAASSMLFVNGGSAGLLRDTSGLPSPPPAPPLDPWLCSLRAVNLARAIQLLLPSNDRRLQNLHRNASNTAATNVEGNVWVMELWPHMVLLMCSPHAAVRHAVADYFCLGVAAAAGLVSAKDSRG